jgi:hypothetical protein
MCPTARGPGSGIRAKTMVGGDGIILLHKDALHDTIDKKTNPKDTRNEGKQSHHVHYNGSRKKTRSTT